MRKMATTAIWICRSSRTNDALNTVNTHPKHLWQIWVLLSQSNLSSLPCRSHKANRVCFVPLSRSLWSGEPNLRSSWASTFTFMIETKELKIGENGAGDGVPGGGASGRFVCCRVFWSILRPAIWRLQSWWSAERMFIQFQLVCVKFVNFMWPWQAGFINVHSSPEHGRSYKNLFFLWLKMLNVLWTITFVD